MRQCRIWLTSHCFTGLLSIRHQINSHSRAMLLSAMEWLLCLCLRPSCLFSALTLSGFKKCLYINSFAKCSKETKHTSEYIVTCRRSKQLQCLLKDKQCSTPRIAFCVQKGSGNRVFWFLMSSWTRWHIAGRRCLCLGIRRLFQLDHCGSKLTPRRLTVICNIWPMSNPLMTRNRLVLFSARVRLKS